MEEPSRNTELNWEIGPTPPGVGFKDLKPFVPPVHLGRVVKVYDGDTITIGAFPYPGAKTANRFSVRLRGIDTPELKTKDENEKSVAILARNYLSNLILGNVVQLREVGTDKYGRLLAIVLFKGQCLSSLMIGNRFAVSYDGKTKKSPPNWAEFYNRIEEEEQNTQVSSKRVFFSDETVHLRNEHSD